MAEMKYGLIQNFCKMNPLDFVFLLNRVGTEIKKKTKKKIHHLEKRFLQ